MASGESGSSSADLRAGNITYREGISISPLPVKADASAHACGEEVLSRRGDLRIDMTGALVDAEQNQILGDAGPITVPEGARDHRGRWHGVAHPR